MTSLDETVPPLDDDDEAVPVEELLEGEETEEPPEDLPLPANDPVPPQNFVTNEIDETNSLSPNAFHH